MTSEEIPTEYTQALSLLTRYLALLFGGACSGLGGAYLSTALTPMWVPGISAGRGWIALALVVFATWKPSRIMLGAYLFGGVTLLQLHAQGMGLNMPPEMLSMLPYAATILVLSGTATAQNDPQTDAYVARMPGIEHLERADYLDRVFLAVKGTGALSAYAWGTLEAVSSVLSLAVSGVLLAMVSQPCSTLREPVPSREDRDGAPPAAVRAAAKSGMAFARRTGRGLVFPLRRKLPELRTTDGCLYANAAIFLLNTNILSCSIRM